MITFEGEGGIRVGGEGAVCMSLTTTGTQFRIRVNYKLKSAHFHALKKENFSLQNISEKASGIYIFLCYKFIETISYSECFISRWKVPVATLESFESSRIYW